MGKPFLVEYNERPSSDYIQCRMCRTQVAFFEDYIDIDIEPPYVPQGIFTKMFNVEVPKDEPYHLVVEGKTLADTYCVHCRDKLGWKFIAVPQGSGYEEGQFLMMLDKLCYSNGQTLAPDDQAGGINEQVPNEQDLGANEENADQDDGDNEQDGGANEDNADQGGGVNEQDGGANEQVPNGHY